MSQEIQVPTSTFELLFGSISEKNEEQIVSLVVDGIEEAFSNAMGIAIAESSNCNLKYLDVTNHPFKDLGNWRELSHISTEDTAEITSGTKCLSFSLPLSEGHVQVLKKCSPAFCIPEKSYADAVNALLLLSYSINKLSTELDQEKVKPVIRGLESDLDILLKEVSFPGMGGVVDTPQSSGSVEVWGHSQNRPDSIPFFVIFE
ncbi:MAG: hypothetical protein KJO81_07650 [Gammaproteobacteria bacterium]|nr:hypothetical protein [Gammaproteobacteria bacterium]